MKSATSFKNAAPVKRVALLEALAQAGDKQVVPVIQAVCSTSSRATWSESDSGLTPLDAAIGGGPAKGFHSQAEFPGIGIAHGNRDT